MWTGTRTTPPKSDSAAPSPPRRSGNSSTSPGPAHSSTGGSLFHILRTYVYTKNDDVPLKCCGTVTIFCNSGSEFGFGSKCGTGSRPYLAVYIFLQKLAFFIFFRQHCFSENCRLFFDFLTFKFQFILDPIPHPIPEPDSKPEPECVQVPAPQHWK